MRPHTCHVQEPGCNLKPELDHGSFTPTLNQSKVLTNKLEAFINRVADSSRTPFFADKNPGAWKKFTSKGPHAHVTISIRFSPPQGPGVTDMHGNFGSFCPYIEYYSEITINVSMIGGCLSLTVPNPLLVSTRKTTHAPVRPKSRMVLPLTYR